MRAQEHKKRNINKLSQDRKQKRINKRKKKKRNVEENIDISNNTVKIGKIKNRKQEINLLNEGGYKIIYKDNQDLSISDNLSDRSYHSDRSVRSDNSNSNVLSNLNLNNSINSNEEEISVNEKNIMRILKEKVSSVKNNKKSNIPWITENTSENLGLLKLHYEILDFHTFIKPNDEENCLRIKTYKMFETIIKNKWPNWTVEMFGSFPNNIHLPDSDVDAVVLKENITSLKNYNSYIRDSIISDSSQLNQIYLELVKRGFVDEIRFVDAKVPIVKIKCKHTQVRMDISANRDNGYKAVQKFKVILAKYPFIQPIVILIKFILRQRNLNETFTGGVSSYLLLNMTYAYLLHFKMEEGKKWNEDFNLGNFFKGFLQFYGEEFNFKELGISIGRGLQFFSKWTRNFSLNDNLCFENFQEPDKDIGKGAYHYPIIVKLFREILLKLNKAKIPSNHSYLSMFINLTSEMKKRKIIEKN